MYLSCWVNSIETTDIALDKKLSNNVNYYSMKLSAKLIMKEENKKFGMICEKNK
jgi:hypothetical protein